MKPSWLYTLDDQGEPVACESMLEWSAWFATADRQVALDTVGDMRISTVFMGMDHAFNGGPPMLWETLIMGGPLDGEGRRYSSRLAAMRGHAEFLARAMSMSSPGP